MPINYSKINGLLRAPNPEGKKFWYMAKEDFQKFDNILF